MSRVFILNWACVEQTADICYGIKQDIVKSIYPVDNKISEDSTAVFTIKLPEYETKV